MAGLFDLCRPGVSPGRRGSNDITLSAGRTTPLSKSRLNRRQFMNRSLAVAGAGFAIGGTRTTGRVIGANDTIRVAVAGLNGRGSAHVGEFGKMPGVAITYLVDPDTRTFDKRVHQ